MRFNLDSTLSEVLYGSQKRQSEIDFFDYCMNGDIRAFFDYTLVKYHAQKGNKLALSIVACVESYMAQVYTALQKSDNRKLIQLLSCLNENKHTKIGYAVSKNGNGVGKILSNSMMDNLLFMRDAMNKGNYSYLSIPLAIEGISNDRSSDILTAISLSVLIKYTEELAVINGWKTKQVLIKRMYNPESGDFQQYKANLPIAGLATPICYPKVFINSSSNINSIFNSLKRRVFMDYIRYDITFMAYWTKNRNYVTKKQFKEIMKSSGKSFKEYLRQHIVNQYAIIDKLEYNLNNIRVPSDEDLEFLQYCRVLKSA
ncbi:hypothetical protein [Sphingobacterium endophyticum]|uniref:hypothetical protein n=1 Tax=Sphingobacterium endophyticum TaxID=2546448 RepID=UPI0012E2DD69|nr:hypothetical protein [Sphingobacterium endophyticum]